MALSAEKGFPIQIGLGGRHEAWWKLNPYEMAMAPLLQDDCPSSHCKYQWPRGFCHDIFIHIYEESSCQYPSWNLLSCFEIEQRKYWVAVHR